MGNALFDLYLLNRSGREDATTWTPFGGTFSTEQQIRDWETIQRIMHPGEGISNTITPALQDVGDRFPSMSISRRVAPEMSQAIAGVFPSGDTDKAPAYGGSSTVKKGSFRNVGGSGLEWIERDRRRRKRKARQVHGDWDMNGPMMPPQPPQNPDSAYDQAVSTTVNDVNVKTSQVALIALEYLEKQAGGRLSEIYPMLSRSARETVVANGMYPSLERILEGRILGATNMARQHGFKVKEYGYIRQLLNPYFGRADAYTNPITKTIVVPKPTFLGMLRHMSFTSALNASKRKALYAGYLSHEAAEASEIARLAKKGKTTLGLDAAFGPARASLRSKYEGMLRSGRITQEQLDGLPPWMKQFIGLSPYKPLAEQDFRKAVAAQSNHTNWGVPARDIYSDLRLPEGHVRRTMLRNRIGVGTDDPVVAALMGPRGKSLRAMTRADVRTLARNRNDYELMRSQIPVDGTPRTIITAIPYTNVYSPQQRAWASSRYLGIPSQSWISDSATPEMMRSRGWGGTTLESVVDMVM